MTDLRARFPIGLRVKLSPAWFRAMAVAHTPRHVEARFTVTGYGQSGRSVRVLRDGRVTPIAYHHSFLEPAEGAS